MIMKKKTKNTTIPLPENPLQHQQELWKSELLAESEHYLKNGRKKNGKGKQKLFQYCYGGKKQNNEHRLPSTAD